MAGEPSFFQNHFSRPGRITQDFSESAVLKEGVFLFQGSKTISDQAQFIQSLVNKLDERVHNPDKSVEELLSELETKVGRLITQLEKHVSE